jgi:Fic family protein
MVPGWHSLFIRQEGGDVSGGNPLGFTWDPEALAGLRRDESVERASFRFHAALPHAVWEAAKYEGSPYTFPEVATLLDGVTVGGHSLSDQALILGLADAAKVMLGHVRDGTFNLTKAISDDLNARIAASEAIESGHFRGEGAAVGGGFVRLGEGGIYEAPEHGPAGANLAERFQVGVDYLAGEVDDHGHQALLYFPFATLSQFYFDGNKRTARWMMNGHLMSHGYEPIGVPVELRQQWNTALTTLFTTLDASELLRILADCQFSRIEERSQGHP